MKKVRITAVRKTCYPDLMERYENPIEHACDVQEGTVWIANGWERPEGFCTSAWDSISAFVMTLAHGGGNFYDGWMKNPKSAMISCNDGFRPVSFYLEALDEVSSFQPSSTILFQAVFNSILESAFFHFSSDGGKNSPISPRPLAPRSASVIACNKTSPSE